MSDSEASEKAEFAESIFGGDQDLASKIPQEVRPLLLERWSKLRHELDSSRASNLAARGVEDAASEGPVQDPSK